MCSSEFHTWNDWTERESITQFYQHPFCMTAFWHNINGINVCVCVRAWICWLFTWSGCNLATNEIPFTAMTITIIKLLICLYSHNSNSKTYRNAQNNCFDHSGLFIIRTNHPKHSQVCKYKWHLRCNIFA